LIRSSSTWRGCGTWEPPRPAGRLAQHADPPVPPVGGIAAERVLARTDPVQQQVDVRAGLPGRQQPVVVLAEGEHDNVLGRLLAVHDDEIELGLPDFQRPNLAQLLGDVLGGDVGCGPGATGSWCAHRLSIWRHQVIGLHFGGRYGHGNYAVPLWMLSADPLLAKGGINFQ